MVKSSASDKDRLRRNFSRHAALYDQYADLQVFMSKELIKLLPDKKVEKILEIGCGTANYTLLLRKRFKSASIKAIDISEEMIEAAGRKCQTAGIEFIVADAEEIDLDEKFDLVTSNACFQWFGNPEKTMEKYRDLLTKNGTICISTFGPGTFRELDKSLKTVLGSQAAISSNRFLDKDKLQALFTKYFNGCKVREMVVKETYPSLLDLLNKIKHTGTRGNGTGNAFLWKRSILDKIEDAYLSTFGNITATYQIFFLGS